LESAKKLFERAERGRTLSRDEYKLRANKVRQRLLDAQVALREAKVPVIILFAGVDRGGKRESANLLHAWMDPRWIDAHAYDDPTQGEAERPPYWRYWRDLPGAGRIGIFLRAWYHEPLLGKVRGEHDNGWFKNQLKRVRKFEKTLADSGALILKFWMHLDKEAQRKRFEELQSDELQQWRVRELDWRNLELYDNFMAAAHQIVEKTNTHHAPWTVIEGWDRNYYEIEVAEAVADAIEEHIAPPPAPEPEPRAKPTVLDDLDMSAALTKREYTQKLQEWQGKLHLLQRHAYDKGISTVAVFQGWDAAGKGGAIRRIAPAIEARHLRVIQIGAPTQEELDQHYLWRFWRHLPRAGHVTIFDRSWYGRVLVERVEGFASPAEWMRAYDEIKEFEAELVDHGIALVKYWLHITKEEQAARFQAREETPHKRWKLTDEDWRNREQWDAYELAVDDMVKRTSTSYAPWTLIAGNDKRYARIKVLQAMCAALNRALERE
jgi:polyphosphate:AMP phosphotransferase